ERWADLVLASLRRVTHDTAGEDLLTSRGISGGLGLRQDYGRGRTYRCCKRQSRNEPAHCLAHGHLQSLSRREEISNLRHGDLLKVLLGLAGHCCSQTCERPPTYPAARIFLHGSDCGRHRDIR